MAELPWPLLPLTPCQQGLCRDKSVTLLKAPQRGGGAGLMLQQLGQRKCHLPPWQAGQRQPCSVPSHSPDAGQTNRRSKRLSGSPVSWDVAVATQAAVAGGGRYSHSGPGAAALFWEGRGQECGQRLLPLPSSWVAQGSSP